MRLEGRCVLGLEPTVQVVLHAHHASRRDQAVLRGEGRLDPGLDRREHAGVERHVLRVGERGAALRVHLPHESTLARAARRHGTLVLHATRDHVARLGLELVEGDLVVAVGAVPLHDRIDPLRESVALARPAGGAAALHELLKGHAQLQGVDLAIAGEAIHPVVGVTPQQQPLALVQVRAQRRPQRVARPRDVDSPPYSQLRDERGTLGEANQAVLINVDLPRQDVELGVGGDRHLVTAWEVRVGGLGMGIRESGGAGYG